MSIKAVNPSETPSLVQAAVITCATLAVITFLATGTIALLVNSQTLILPLSINTILIAGMSTGIFFALLSIVLKFACSGQKKAVDEGTTTGAKGKDGQVPAHGTQQNAKPNLQGTNPDGHSSLNPEGKGNPSGAQGAQNTSKPFNVLPGQGLGNELNL